MAVGTRIAVVGQGIIGLAAAARLIDHGYSVDIFSRHELSETTSMAAGAYWWPHKAYPRERITRWSKATYDEYARRKGDAGAGIHFEQHFRFCIDPDDTSYVRHLADEYEDVDGSLHGLTCSEAFRVLVPVVDVPLYLPHLRSAVLARGATITIRELQSPADLSADYRLVVNCTGVWSHFFVNDSEVTPLKGQTVCVSRPEGLRDSTRLFQKADTFTLVLPRLNDVVLGGTAYEGDWSLEPNDDDTRLILERCIELVPEIAQSKILGTTVGLRPARKEVRLELESVRPGFAVIHNYGHGGAGYTLAWGCADEVVELAARYFSPQKG